MTTQSAERAAQLLEEIGHYINEATHIENHLKRTDASYLTLEIVPARDEHYFINLRDCLKEQDLLQFLYEHVIFKLQVLKKELEELK